jgi:nucleoside-diphosphate-sugar epimerase
VVSRTALVTGATGVIGPVLVDTLLQRGYRVRALARRPSAADTLPADVEVINGDILDPQALRRAVDSTDVVFHLAAKLHINNPGKKLEREYQRINVEGTRLLGEAAREAGAQRLVFFSTIAVYGRSKPGQVLDEGSPLLARSIYGLTKRDAEETVLALTRTRDGCPLAVVLRIAGVYGPRIKGNYRELVRWMQRGFFVSVGPGRNRRTLVYDRDVAAAAILAGEHPDAAGRIYNVTDGSIHSFREILSAISEALGRRTPRLGLPVAPSRAGAALIDLALNAAGRPPRAAALIEKLVEDMAVSGDRIKEELGFRPCYDLSTGWRETIPQLMD